MTLLLLLACSGKVADSADTSAGSNWFLPLPDGFPEPVVPAENPATPEKQEFGRYLFYDRRLSGNGTQACADCHDPTRAFTDGIPTPTGSTGDPIPRNSLVLANLAWEATYTWPNPLLTTLEDQLLVPMYNDHPVELGMSGHEDEIEARLAADSVYDELGAAAFPGEDPLTRTNLVRAIATFCRGLVSAGSPYDRYVYAGDGGDMSEPARRGEALFFGEQAECYHCHSGPNLTASFVSVQSAGQPDAFFNNGLYNVDGEGGYPADNTGLYEITGIWADMGRFRTPTLRNVALTAPYMHDGSLATLQDVIEHYDRGGTLTEDGPNAGDGATNPYKSPLVHAMNLTTEQKADLIAFLEALTDQDFVDDPSHGDPWPADTGD